MVLANKFLLHQPLNRQSKTYAREGIEIDVSTLADRVGACVVALDPIIEAVRNHVMSAERIHADDTTVPVLAKLKTVTGRIWIHVRDDRPFGGTDPPAALLYHSRNRAGEHPQNHLAGYVGLMQADAFDGYNQLYKAQRKPAPILEAPCWSHGRRKFFDLAKSGEAPIASEAVRRIDILLEIERIITVSIRRRPRSGHFRLRRLDQRSGWRSSNSMAGARRASGHDARRCARERRRARFQRSRFSVVCETRELLDACRVHAQFYLKRHVTLHPTATLGCCNDLHLGQAPSFTAQRMIVVFIQT